jgi:cold shock CspA family protein/ribosome-associated translation inhibitor RaiA
MEIHWSHAEEISEDERRAIEARLAALAQGHTDMIDLRIVGRGSGHHRHGGKEIRVTCQVRGKEIVAARSANELGLALDQAIDAFEREVRKLREIRSNHRDERPQSPPFLGIVDRVLHAVGYGFIVTDGGEKVYFHRNAVHGGLHFERLAEGDRVALNLEAGEKGLQATTVVPAPPGVPTP